MKLYRKTHLYVKHLESSIIAQRIQGCFGLYAHTAGILYDYQLKAIVFFLKKRLKGYSKVFVRISLNKYTTKRPTGIRMGKGKGSIDRKYYFLKKGQLLFEFHFSKVKEQSVEKLNFLRHLLFCINQKMPIVIRLVKI